MCARFPVLVHITRIFHQISTPSPTCSLMATEGPRRSSRFATSSAQVPPETSAQLSDETLPENPPPPPAGSPRRTSQRSQPVPKCTFGERYKVPGDQFDEDSDDDEPHPEFFYGVVTAVQKTGCKMLFQGGDISTRYDGHLQTWKDYRVNSDLLTEEEENIFQAIEVKAKFRRPPAARARRTTVATRNQHASDSDASGSDSDGSDKEGPTEVETWESDAEDDENEAEPDVDGDDNDDNGSLEAQFARGTWEDVPRLATDPRAAGGPMPENIAPAFLMPSYREEPLLSWFLFYMPLSVIAEMCAATNNAAKDIAWSRDNRWKHLRTGEFLRWVGLWVLMTVYPLAGGERGTYWRGMLKFQQYMAEKRFESILRAFTLPQYKHADRGWGGQGRPFYEEKKYDKFQETRKFTDYMRKQFRKALKLGGWFCIDESMVSWLGRALKLPGWKVIKRKPHPIGLEAKTLACAVAGVLVDFEFQEGTVPMGYFEYVDTTNRSSAWLLRLTKAWHNTEQRTVIADAAFAQVRAAVALMRTGGLYFIGNVKGCTKFFCKQELKDECGNYERDEVVCLTKKITLGGGADAVTVYGTGWRCTGDMVVAYVHTGGMNAEGSDRTKRKYTQMSDGKINTTSYHVKRPKVSSEYQHRMGAIDAHNYRRQFGKGVGALEKVCVTNSTKDRIFISIVSWVLINIYLIRKYFMWGGEDKENPSEFQQKVALALINNQLLSESQRDHDADPEYDLAINDLHYCRKHPEYKKNLCKYCYRHKTVYYCVKCRKPKEPKLRRESGPKGGRKYTSAGYMHFCKHGGCFLKHKCGEVPRRRSKAQMSASSVSSD